MFGWIKERFRERRALKFGEDLGREIIRVIDAYLDERLPELSHKLFDVLQQRLASIYDDESSAPPHIRAVAEWRIFLENTSDLSSTVVRQSREAMPQVYEALASFGSEEKVDAYIREKADVTKDRLIKRSYLEFTRIWIELEKSQGPIPDGPDLLYGAASEVPGLMQWVASGDKELTK